MSLSPTPESPAQTTPTPPAPTNWYGGLLNLESTSRGLARRMKEGKGIMHGHAEETAYLESTGMRVNFVLEVKAWTAECCELKAITIGGRTVQDYQRKLDITGDILADTTGIVLLAHYLQRVQDKALTLEVKQPAMDQLVAMSRACSAAIEDRNVANSVRLALLKRKREEEQEDDTAADTGNPATGQAQIPVVSEEDNSSGSNQDIASKNEEHDNENLKVED